MSALDRLTSLLGDEVQTEEDGMAGLPTNSAKKLLRTCFEGDDASY